MNTGQRDRIAMDAILVESELLNERVRRTLSLGEHLLQLDHDVAFPHQFIFPADADGVGNGNHHRNNEQEVARELLRRLGVARRQPGEPFVDAAALMMFDPAGFEGDVEPTRGGRSVYFPQQLEFMLRHITHEGDTSIVSYLAHGRAFRIDDKVRFEREILPRFFPSSGDFRSFERKLRFFGFLKIRSGPDICALYHPLFLRGHRQLLRFMRRVGSSSNDNNSVDRRRRVHAGQVLDPDFSSLPPLP